MNFWMYDEVVDIKEKNGEEQVVDVLTKTLSRVKFEYF